MSEFGDQNDITPLNLPELMLSCPSCSSRLAFNSETCSRCGGPLAIENLEIPIQAKRVEIKITSWADAHDLKGNLAVILNNDPALGNGWWEEKDLHGVTVEPLDVEVYNVSPFTITCTPSQLPSVAQMFKEMGNLIDFYNPSS